MSTVPDYQPPIRWWGALGRLGGCVAISILATIELAFYQAERHPLWFWVGAVTGVASYGVLRWRRTHPLVVAVGVNLLSIFSPIASGPAVLATVSVATRRRSRELVLAAAVSFLSGTAFYWIQPRDADDPVWFDMLFNALLTAAMIGWGMFIGSRRELVWTLRHRAETAEAEQGLRVAQARATERRRIAREMHDVLAHRISQIAVQAGAMEFREDLSADELRHGIGLVRQKSHEALTDLRTVLGVLRDDHGELAPQPTYADLDRLIEEARTAGMSVDVVDRVAPDLPDPTGRTLYRLVQEGLTNARKHAPGSRVTVSLTGSPEDGVQLEIRNPLGFHSGTPGAGLGLIGLTERATLAGGSLDHGRHGDLFILRAWIPWAS
ncbi:sensor histidine kinase [Nocardioides insulae]|uniref:sensor histidine kinase n=1 Tax=Nocardioides insulae TaxID=394734 RepID=UPI00041F3F77|nr:histidine kinase [Nocardioides insulae]